MEFRDTPHGRLYKPQPWPVLAVCFVGSFAGGILSGYLLSLVFGLTTDFGRALCIGSFILIYVFGYATWLARLQLLASAVFGKGLFKLFWNLIVRRKLPRDIRDVIPDEDQLTRLAVQAQKATSAFFQVAVMVAALGGLLVAVANGEMGGFLRLVIMMAACMAYGFAVSELGRKGCLPFPEEE